MGPDQLQDDDELKRRANPQWDVNAGFGGVPLSAPRVAAPSTGPSLNVPKIGPAQTELQRIESTGSGVSQIHNPILRGLARVGDAIGTFAAPNVMAAIPGTSVHHNFLLGQQSRLANQEASYGQKQAQGAQEQAQAGHLNAETAALQNPVDKPASNEVELYQKSPEELEKFYTSRESHQQDKKPAPLHLSTDQGEFLVDPVTHEATPLTYNGQPLKKSEPAGNFDEKAYQEEVKRNPNLSRLQFLQMKANETRKPEGEQGTWSIQEGDDHQPVLFNSKTGATKPAPPGIHPKGMKPTADEQRRADLAGNLEENLQTLEEIVNRRGDELFGPIAGRMTRLKASFGSNDPDIGTLGTIKHQLGMAQISAHGMRSAQGIEGAATSILNNLKNGPDAVRASIKAARNSVQTFKADVAAAKGQSQQQSAPPAQQNNDPLGIR
jgi:hypothetical protein